MLTGPAATDTNVLLAVTARFADACDTRQAGDGSTWLMRDPERRWELAQLAATGDLDRAIRWRRTLPSDGPTDDLLDALSGTGAFAPAALAAALTDGTPRNRLEQLAVAIDRAGPTAPGRSQVDAIKAEIIRLDARSRDEVLLQRGFYGREAERGELAAWLAGPPAAVPVSALFITGLPGMGKSTLLDEAVRQAMAMADAATPGRGWLTARLDFDRAGLDVQDRIGLTVELARQLAAELGDQAAALRSARLEASGFAVSNESSIKGEGRERTPVPLAQTVAAAVGASGRPLLVILDTLEVLRSRGETHPERLFGWLDELVSFGVGPMWLLAAGRGDALDSAPGRVGRRIELHGLDDTNADRMLEGLGVPPESFAAVREIAQGSPLVLRLAARVVLEAGPGALDTASKRRGVAAAYLYRFLLSRIDDPTLRTLAHPGLVVRRINAEVIGEVLGPQLGIRLDPAEAQRVFEALASHHWLVEPDPAAPGFVKHRTDMRSVLLPLLYKDQPAKCDRIDRAAADWFGRRPEPWCAVESATTGCSTCAATIGRRSSTPRRCSGSTTARSSSCRPRPRRSSASSAASAPSSSAARPRRPPTSRSTRRPRASSRGSSTGATGSRAPTSTTRRSRCRSSTRGPGMPMSRGPSCGGRVAGPRPSGCSTRATGSVATTTSPSCRRRWPRSDSRCAPSSDSRRWWRRCGPTRRSSIGSSPSSCGPDDRSSATGPSGSCSGSSGLIWPPRFEEQRRRRRGRGGFRDMGAACG